MLASSLGASFAMNSAACSVVLPSDRFEDFPDDGGRPAAEGEGQGRGGVGAGVVVVRAVDAD